MSDLLTGFLHAWNLADATDEMVRKANADINQALAAIPPQAARLKEVGLSDRAMLKQHADIGEKQQTANAKPTNNERYAALKDILAEAEWAGYAAKGDADAQLHSAFDGITAAIVRLRDAAAQQIRTLADDNDRKQPLTDQMKQLAKDVDDANKITDRTAMRKKLVEIEAAARKLFDDAVEATGDRSVVNATYQKALEERYGITVSNPLLHSNTHLDKVYRMFGAVPLDNVVHNRLQKLNYTSVESITFEGGIKRSRASAAYGSATIQIGDYGDNPEDWAYKTPAEGFSISTLHEIGHSVDDRYNIMAKIRESSDAGGWRKETIEAMVPHFYDQFVATSINGEQIDKALMIELIQTALKSGKRDRPANMTDTHWAEVEPFLVTCSRIRTDEAPWDRNIRVGQRGYCESYSGEWWSYDSQQRRGKTVRNYQWRSPAEWFAELYAYSWFKQEAPTSINAEAAEYMWGAQ